MGRKTFTGSSPGFVADYQSVARNSGRQIDWTKIGDEYRQYKHIIKADGGNAAGSTSIDVDAIPVDLPIGTILNFGNYAAVTVTVGSTAAVGAVSITVSALSGPIPAGTILDFGAGAGLFALVTADAAAGATSLTVEALPEEIAAAKTASFKGGTIQARLTAAAAKGAVALTVDELQFAVADDAEATYGGAGTGPKIIKAGTIMAELSGGKIVPRAVITGSETAIGLLVSDAEEDAYQDALSGHGVFIGGVFYDELLPETGHASFDTWIGEIKTAGPGLRLETFSDSRAS